MINYAQRIRRELTLNGPRKRIVRYVARTLYGKSGTPSGFERYKKAATVAFGDDWGGP